MAQAKNIHIIELSKDLVDRLHVIKLKPDHILSESVDAELLKKIYPLAQFVKEGRADLILEAIEFFPAYDLTEQLSLWRKRIKPGGLLLFGLINSEIDIQELGDFLLWLGFVNVVVDSEENVVYVHALGPDEVSVKINQIHRAR